jgi:peptidoglycan/xylan/chitin deacetylase (PgdA/CDA1 family)
MKFKYLIINFLSVLFNFLKINEKCNFRILMVHNIKKKNFQLLENNLKTLKKNYNFINPNVLKKSNFPKGKNNLLLTFDDGFKSNYIFAKTILKKLKIKVVFFIVTDLINSNNYIKKKLIIKNILPGKNFSNSFKYNAMSWNDVRQLQKMGHVIGSHTKSHLRLSDIKSLPDLRDQIISPIYTLKKNKIKKPIFFAYSFGDFYSFNKKCFDIAKSNYKFIFSGIRGDNFKLKKILYRDNIEDDYSLKTINFFLRGHSDFLYKKYRRIFSFF